jgi:hypothetical protein
VPPLQIELSSQRCQRQATQYEDFQWISPRAIALQLQGLGNGGYRGNAKVGGVGADAPEKCR